MKSQIGKRGKFWQNKKVLTPKNLELFFHWGQVILLLFCIWIFWWYGFQGKKSSFRFREADRFSNKKKGLFFHRTRIVQPHQLAGISLTGAPHEVLGIRENATEIEIQRVYRELMKQYHPDRVGRPGSREWKEAQKIAEVINWARQEMLKLH